MRIKAVIFDMDGTLLDTLDDLHDSVNVILTGHGFAPITLAQTRRFVGNGIDKLVQRALPPDAGEATAALLGKEMKEYYAGHCLIKTAPYRGIPEAIDELAGRGIKSAVVTNKAQAAADNIARRFFDGRLDAVIGDDGVLPLKPAPEPVFKAMSALKATADTAVYVGDSEVDVMTGRNAGLRTISVLWGFRGKDELTAAGAKEFAASPSELAKLV